MSEVTLVEKKKRRRFEQVDSLEDRLAADTKALREQLALLATMYCVGSSRTRPLRHSVSYSEVRIRS